MIAYQTKQNDREEYQMALDILESAIGYYQRTGNTGHLIYWEEEASRIKTKINNHDYTEDEKKYNSVFNHLESLKALI